MTISTVKQIYHKQATDLKHGEGIWKIQNIQLYKKSVQDYIHEEQHELAKRTPQVTFLLLSLHLHSRQVPLTSTLGHGNVSMYRLPAKIITKTTYYS